MSDAQEFVRRGLATQASVDALTSRVDELAAKTPKLRAAKKPNKTEAEYGRILESMKSRGEIIEYRYEGITLKWADMRYTPDWFVITERALSGVIEFNVADQSKPDWVRIKLIEVKGAHIWDRDTVRFKGARAAWPMFAFEMHQKKGAWRRIL